MSKMPELVVLFPALLLFLHVGFSVAAKNTFYTVKWDRVDVINHDYNIINATGQCHFYNRTTKALDLTLDLKVTLTDSYVVYVLANKWINNNWVKYSAIQFTESLKTLAKMEWFDLQALYKIHSKPPLIWPWQNIVYKIRNFVIDSDKFPPYIPTGYYKAEVTFFDSKKKDHRVFAMNWYLNLVPLTNLGKT